MGEKQTYKQELEEIEGKETITVNGKNYVINAMPLAYVREYMSEPLPLFTSTKDAPNLVMYNFMIVKDRNGNDVDMEELVKKWVPRLLEHNGRPCELETLYEHKWSAVDFDKFLKRALLISG